VHSTNMARAYGFIVLVPFVSKERRRKARKQARHELPDGARSGTVEPHTVCHVGKGESRCCHPAPWTPSSRNADIPSAAELASVDSSSSPVLAVGGPLLPRLQHELAVETSRIGRDRVHPD
jgi:hypothetical protein